MLSPLCGVSVADASEVGAVEAHLLLITTFGGPGTDGDPAGVADVGKGLQKGPVVAHRTFAQLGGAAVAVVVEVDVGDAVAVVADGLDGVGDRKSTRLNS